MIDADGLNNLAKMKNWTSRLRAELILTPHPGEMKRLWEGLFREELPGERQEQAGRLSERTKCVVVLKGAGTVVTDGERVYVNKTGNPGMATAGSGDVLTGVIAALAGLVSLVLLVCYLFGAINVPGWTSVVLSVWFLSGVIMLVLGIHGFYLGRVFAEVRDRPRVWIEQTTFDLTSEDSKH